jgi:hypothetical protein
MQDDSQIYNELKVGTDSVIKQKIEQGDYEHNL